MWTFSGLNTHINQCCMFIEWHLILKGFSNKISDGPKRHCGRWGRFFLNVYGWQELFYLIKKRTSSVEFIKQQKKYFFPLFFCSLSWEAVNSFTSYTEINMYTRSRIKLVLFIVITIDKLFSLYSSTETCNFTCLFSLLIYSFISASIWKTVRLYYDQLIYYFKWWFCNSLRLLCSAHTVYVVCLCQDV